MHGRLQAGIANFCRFFCGTCARQRLWHTPMPSPAASGAHGIAVEIDVQPWGVAETVLFAPLGDLGGEACRAAASLPRAFDDFSVGSNHLSFLISVSC